MYYTFKRKILYCFLSIRHGEKVQVKILLAACRMVCTGCWLVRVQAGCTAGSCFLGNWAEALKIRKVLLDTAALEASWGLMRIIHLFHDNTLILQLIKIFSLYASLPSSAWHAMHGEQQQLVKNSTDLWQNSKQCNIDYLEHHRDKLSGSAVFKWEGHSPLRNL